MKKKLPRKTSITSKLSKYCFYAKYTIMNIYWKWWLIERVGNSRTWKAVEELMPENNIGSKKLQFLL
jgi:hypothetical protein